MSRIEAHALRPIKWINKHSRIKTKPTLCEATGVLLRAESAIFRSRYYPQARDGRCRLHEQFSSVPQQCPNQSIATF